MSDPITSTPGVMGGQPCIAGTRITTAGIRDWHLAGYTDDQIAGEYPRLRPEQVRAAIDYEERSTEAHRASIGMVVSQHDTLRALTEATIAARPCDQVHTGTGSLMTCRACEVSGKAWAAYHQATPAPVVLGLLNEIAALRALIREHAEIAGDAHAKAGRHHRADYLRGHWHGLTGLQAAAEAVGRD